MVAVGLTLSSIRTSGSLTRRWSCRFRNPRGAVPMIAVGLALGWTGGRLVLGWSSWLGHTRGTVPVVAVRFTSSQRRCSSGALGWRRGRLGNARGTVPVVPVRFAGSHGRCSSGALTRGGGRGVRLAIPYSDGISSLSSPDTRYTQKKYLQ